MTKQGRVIESTGSWYEVFVESGEESDRTVVNCRLPGRFRLEGSSGTNPVVVGDKVEISINKDDTGNIEQIHDRENYIVRQATHNRHGEQVLVANIDHAYVVQSILKPRLKQGFIDRFLVTCEAYEIEASIIINKMDLARKKERETADHITGIYREIGYPVFHSSIEDEQSIETLRKELTGRTSVLIGHSGVGKTSLINKIDPQVERPTADVSGYSEKGKHTTTFAKLLPLQTGGYLVDTPGIKEFGLVRIEPWELSFYFPEMREARLNCKFNNCTHSHEPGCGVVEAFENGSISPERYDSYLNILDSLTEV